MGDAYAAAPGAERLQDFRVIKRLGKGAFGQVFQVVRKSDSRNYALKKVDISKMSQREVQDALNEIRFLASLHHPNIVGFLEAFLNERTLELCIVMEFADGGDLAGQVEKYKAARKYMDEDLIWSYILQLLEGLVALHERRILHRDLKTANCFITSDGKLKIGDLNVSKLATMGLVKTQIGTPYYMSPEIWHGRPYNDKSDMWSVGVIMYELAALTVPFKGADMDELSKRVQAGAYPRIPAMYSQDLDQTIRRLLMLDPRHRPTAKQFFDLPTVRNHVARLKDRLERTLISELAGLDGSMLATIQVPRNIRRLTNQLPKPCYPDSRPHSPGAWPVTAKERREALAAVEAVTAKSDPMPATEARRVSRAPPDDDASVANKRNAAGVVPSARRVVGSSASADAVGYAHPPIRGVVVSSRQVLPERAAAPSAAAVAAGRRVLEQPSAGGYGGQYGQQYAPSARAGGGGNRLPPVQERGQYREDQPGGAARAARLPSVYSQAGGGVQPLAVPRPSYPGNGAAPVSGARYGGGNRYSSRNTPSGYAAAGGFSSRPSWWG